ncbi:hypothetical protein DIPPA_20603 [Diplonema papillatum]|nr:hypothetical protein DIPPA_20603 [Diplonema papillatum]
MAATRLLLRHENVPFCIVGILAVMCLVSVPVVLGVYIRRSIPAKAFHKRELVNPRQFRRVHKLLIRVLAFVTGTGEWVSRSEDDPWVTRHLAMVKPFRQGAASFVCFELLAMGLLAFASACRTGSLVACGHVKATSAIVCFAGCTLRLKMHPSAYPRDDYIEPFRLSVQSTALVLQAVGFYSENEDHRAFSIATPLFGVAMGLFGLKILLDVITFLATSDRVTVLQEQAYAKVDWDAELLELDVSPDFSDGKVDPQGGCRTRGSSDAARGVDLRNVSFQLPGPAHAGRGLTPPSSALSSPSSLKLSTGTSPAMRPQQVYRTSDVVSAASPSPPCKDDGSVEFELLFDNNSPALIPCEFQTTHRRRSRWSITPPGNESIFSSTLDKTVLPLMNHTPSHSSQFLQSSDSGSMTGRGHRSGSVPTCDQRSLPAIRRVLLEPGVEDRLDDTLLSSIHSFDRRSSLSVSSIHRRIALGPRAATPDTRSLSATRRTRSDSLTRPAALISKKTSSSITFI